MQGTNTPVPFHPGNAWLRPLAGEEEREDLSPLWPHTDLGASCHYFMKTSQQPCRASIFFSSAITGLETARRCKVACVNPAGNRRNFLPPSCGSKLHQVPCPVCLVTPFARLQFPSLPYELILRWGFHSIPPHHPKPYPDFSDWGDTLLLLSEGPHLLL